MIQRLRNIGWVAVGAIVLYWAATTLVGTVFSGPLDPPAAPAETQKTQITSLPYTISASGSYIVMSSLTCAPCAGTGDSGITIDADNVTLDLNGFELGGPGAGSGDGIEVINGPRFNIRIENGTVLNWGGDGVDAFVSVNGQFVDLRAAGNSAIGLRVGNSATVNSCSATGNDFGITADDNTTIIGCSANANTFTGIVVDDNATIVDCIADGNGSEGIFAGNVSVIDNCTTSGNGSAGIAVGSDAVIRQVSSFANAAEGITTSGFHRVNISDCAASGNGTNGISVANDSIVTNCVAVGNSGGDGIVVGGRNTISGNTANLNAGSGVHTTAGGNRVQGNDAQANGGYGIEIDAVGRSIIVQNSAGGNTTGEYLIPASQTAGPIIVGPVDPLPAGTNPWANFEY